MAAKDLDERDTGNLRCPDSVEITENMGEWFVRVVRDGKVEITVFQVEAYAESFAAGQRAGLNSVRKPPAPSIKA
ncbi:hypothetical protein MesoLj113c_27430 [Mesorhizobium sp. 113-3-9]|jgi:hypothetical protein|nr:hypothetical protein FJ977_23115 [Mesorhizobium sp. B2-1-3A]BCG86633.1 hypothetical protein MesoLj113c_27430 [Mesorhizobium sp. 113-3-9]